MTGSRAALAALAIWASHFFVAYGLMLAFPEGMWVGGVTIALGILCISGIVFVLGRSAGDRRMLLVTGLITGAAIAWQSIVGFF